MPKEKKVQETKKEKVYFVPSKGKAMTDAEIKELNKVSKKE